jgi:diguanylate cyclase (GGDEF)-like protein
METKEMLNEFLESTEWKVMVDLIQRKLGIGPLGVMDKDGKLISTEERDRGFCRMVKATAEGNRGCSAAFTSIFERVTKSHQPTVFSCHAGFLGYLFPIMVEKELIGMVYGCQLIDASRDPHYYDQLIERLHLDSKAFFYTMKGIPQVNIGSLEADISLLSFLANTSMELIAEKNKRSGKEQEVESITKFYELFEKSRSLLLTLEPTKLYPLIVNLASKAMNAEICSLMILDPKKEELTIKAAVGLDEKIMEKTFKKGAGVVGYVAKTGEPLLVKDITKDSRFHVERSLPKYYTKSLISAPLKVGDEVFGVLNMNNKASRAPFNETDLKLLSIICGHAAIAIKNARTTTVWSEEKEKVAEELIHDQEEKEKVVLEKEKLIEKKEDLEIKLKEKEEALKIKMELLAEKERHIQDKEKFEEEKRKLTEAINQLQKERDDLRGKIKKSEALIHEKEELEKKLEETIREKEELEAQTEELGILYAISTEAPNMQKPKDILSWVLEKIQPFFNYHASAYLYLDGERLIGEIKQACFVSDECLKKVEEEMGNAWRKYSQEDIERIPQFFTEKREESSDLFWVGLKEFQSDLVFPVVHGDRIRGLISVYSFNKEPFSPLQRRLLRIISHQISETLERVALFTKIKEMAEKDELTKTYNYRYLEDYLAKEFAYAANYKKPLSLIMIDFDRLKYVNDNYGHAEGNRLIVTISNIIKKTMDGKGLIARFGGDEFAVVLPETDQNVAFDYAEKIRANIASHHMVFGGKPHKITASLGVSAYPNDGIESEKDLFAKADKSLYQAKEAGRNKVILYEP